MADIKTRFIILDDDRLVRIERDDGRGSFKAVTLPLADLLEFVLDLPLEKFSIRLMGDANQHIGDYVRKLLEQAPNPE